MILDSIISTVGDLPASPTIVSSLMGLTSDLNSDIEKVSRTLASDQSLTVRVLKLSNSPFYGRSKGVGSLEEAVLVLGFFTVRSMVLATSAYNMFSQSNLYSVSSKLWRHSLATAVAARQIAAYTKYSDKEELFVAALLHDVGKLVLVKQVPDIYEEVVLNVEQNQSSFKDEEVKQLGFNHCDVAKAMLEKWAFPDHLIEAVYNHHSNENNASDEINLSEMIELGNYAAKTLDIGFNDTKLESLVDLPVSRKLGLDEKAMSSILADFEENFNIELRIIEGK